MNKTAITAEKNYISWIKFVVTWILFLGFNLLILYFYPRNIYTDISFILVVFFTFKFLRLNSINIFLYGISYLWLAFIIIFFRNYISSLRLIDSITFYITFYIPCFFILSFMLYLYEEKIEKKITFRKKKISYLCMFCVFSVLFIFLFISFNLEQPSTKIIASSIKIIANSTKQSINRIFKKQEYYSKKEFVIIDGEKVKEEIATSKYSSKQGITFSRKIKINGWAIEKNSKYDTGIDRIEFFLDGKPGEGKYLGKFTQNYSAELETKKFIKNLYFNFYDRMPDSSELNFWAINLEYSIMSYSEVANNIINKYDFMGRNLSNKDFLGRLFAGLFRRDWDGNWIDRLENDLSREDILYIFINSIEFNKLSEDYYKNITLKNHNLDIIRKDIAEEYGKQFCLSGFRFEFDSTAFPNGEHTLYIYAHSPVFGWDYQTVNLMIENH